MTMMTTTMTMIGTGDGGGDIIRRGLTITWGTLPLLKNLHSKYGYRDQTWQQDTWFY
jgi:hypothetical protein